MSSLPSDPWGKLILQCLDSTDLVNLLIVNYALAVLENAAQEKKKKKKRKVPARWEEPSGRPGKFPNKSRPCTSISSVTQTVFSLWKKAKVSNFDSFHIKSCCFILEVRVLRSELSWILCIWWNSTHKWTCTHTRTHKHYHFILTLKNELKPKDTPICHI